MRTMDTLFIEGYQESSSRLQVNVETFLILYVYRVADPVKIELVIKLHDKKADEPYIEVDLTNIKHAISTNIPEATANCVWPIILSEKNIIAGLCSVARQLIKCSKAKEVKNLLGFREACLMACQESSIWTRFCEVDIIETTKKLLQNRYYKTGMFYLPEDVARFNFHLSKPVRMHNVYKAAREKNKDKGIQCSVPIEQLNLQHTFGEGMDMTLADIILYPCFEIFFSRCPLELFKEKLPLLSKWFDRMSSSKLPALSSNFPNFDMHVTHVVEPDFIKQSLYTSDPSRYRPEKRIYTKQNDIEKALKLVNSLENIFINDLQPFGHEIRFNWADIPLEANPNGGALPPKRANRKCEQLENLAKAVVKLAADRTYKIVDFCSGSGHLGILLAVLLPNSQIILIENKERSLERAVERIKKLKLGNITMVQSNLDYFIGHFDIGVSLHACGVATDLVIQNCISNEAHFVACPCCYGGVKDCYNLKYPRSRHFQKLNLGQKNYLNFAHAADQTHDLDNIKTKQGYLCMDIIDTDRRLHAESCGYDVHLGKLQPTSCTNKNNLLVGVFRDKR